MLVPLVPRPVLIIIEYLVLILLLRRIWLFVVKKERVPASFSAVPKVLGYAGVSFYAIALVALGLSMLLRVGSGVPAGMLMIPAMFLIPWAFFAYGSTQLLSSKGRTQSRCIMRSPNSALLTDAFSGLRRAYGAVKRGR